MDATTCKSAMATVARALGWKTSAFKADDGIHVEVRYGLDPITYIPPDGLSRMMAFVADSPEEIVQMMDDVLKSPIQATCWSEDLMPPQSWNLPGFPTTEYAAMRVSLGQHKTWRTN